MSILLCLADMEYGREGVRAVMPKQPAPDLKQCVLPGVHYWYKQYIMSVNNEAAMNMTMCAGSLMACIRQAFSVVPCGAVKWRHYSLFKAPAKRPWNSGICGMLL